MKKLTASIFTVLLGVVSVNAADAAVASKGYVDQEVGKANTAIAAETQARTTAIADEVTARNTAISTAVSAETSARETAVSGLQASIDAISNAETGILATANKYTDTELDKLEQSLSGTTTNLTELSNKVDTNEENIGKNTSAIGVLNGDVSTAGSVAKSIADALVDYSTTSEVESKIADMQVKSNIVTNVDDYQAAIADGTSASKYTSVAVVESKLGVLTAGTAGLETAIGDVTNMGDTFSDAGLDAADLIGATVEVQGNVDELGTIVANNAAAATTAASNAETNAKAYTDEEIQKLDTAGEITTANQVIVAVSEKDGVISARSSAITGDYITDGTVLRADLDSGVQASLGLADSALQSENVNWLAKNLNVPTECSDATNYCVLTYNNTGFVWEVIARGTEGDNAGK